MKINIHEFSKKFSEEYGFIYDHHDNVAGYSEAVAEFDARIHDKNFMEFVGEFCRYRGDFISSDREAGAFMFALSSFE